MNIFGRLFSRESVSRELMAVEDVLIDVKDDIIFASECDSELSAWKLIDMHIEQQTKDSVIVLRR